MSRRTAAFLLLALTLLLIALSTGAAIYYLLFLMMAMLSILATAASIATLCLMRVKVVLPAKQVTRGDNFSMRVQLTRRSPLPVGQVELMIASSQAGEASSWMSVNLPPMRTREYRYPISCPHRGSYKVGISAVRVTDVFGLFCLRRRLHESAAAVEVLPRVDHAASEIDIVPGETGPQSRILSTEDTSSPAGVRSWQEGDELKRVHWKLSLRKHELMVRTYEESARPDTLVLMDCSPISAPRGEEATLEDGLCEAALAAVFAQLREGYPVRMPLNNASPTELSAQTTAQFSGFVRQLTYVKFDSPYSFEQVMELEMRRMQRTGGVVLVTARLDGRVADMALRMRRQDMVVHLIWVGSGAGQEETVLLEQLESQGLTAEQVNPWNS